MLAAPNILCLFSLKNDSAGRIRTLGKRSLMVETRIIEKGMRKPAHKTPNYLKQLTELRKGKQVNLKLENLKTDTTLTEENVAA